VKIFFCLLSFISAEAFASEGANQTLLNAITVCPPNSNPMKYLKQVGGNSFGNAEFDLNSSTRVQVDLIRNPQLLNPMIAAPIVILGKLSLEMTYPAPGFGLVCEIHLVGY
jgi:hypothetical protein